jgi:hypothetical protein
MFLPSHGFEHVFVKGSDARGRFGVGLVNQPESIGRQTLSIGIRLVAVRPAVFFV